MKHWPLFVFVLSSAPLALAAPPPAADALLPHVRLEIQRAVQGADAIAVARVVDTEGAGARQVALQVTHAVSGDVGGTLALERASFHPLDVTPGAELLLFLRRAPGAEGGGPRWVALRRYERVLDGTVREQPLAVYLAQVEQAHTSLALREAEAREAAAARAARRPAPQRQGRRAPQLTADTVR